MLENAFNGLVAIEDDLARDPLLLAVTGVAFWIDVFSMGVSDSLLGLIPMIFGAVLGSLLFNSMRLRWLTNPQNNFLSRSQ